MNYKIIIYSLFSVALFASGCDSSSEEENGSDTLIGQVAAPDLRTQFRNNPPKPDNWVADFDSVFTTEEEQKLNTLIEDFEKETSMEIVILTLDTPRVANDSFYNLVYELSNKWGVGKKEKNNGMVIAICKGYGKFRIATGTETEKMLPNPEAEEIMNTVFFPLLREGKFFEAFHTGTKKVISVLKPRAAKASK